MGAQRAISTNVYRHQKQVGGSEPREPLKAQLPEKGPEGKGRSPVHNSAQRGAGPSQASPERILNLLYTSIQEKSNSGIL